MLLRRITVSEPSYGGASPSFGLSILTKTYSLSFKYLELKIFELLFILCPSGLDFSLYFVIVLLKILVKGCDLDYPQKFPLEVASFGHKPLLRSSNLL